MDNGPSSSPANLRINVFLPSHAGEDGRDVPAIDVIVHRHEGSSAHATVGPLNPVTGSPDLTSGPHPRPMSPSPFLSSGHKRGPRTPSPCSTAHASVSDITEGQDSYAPSVNWIDPADVADVRQYFADRFTLTNHPQNLRFRFDSDRGRGRQGVVPSMWPFSVSFPWINHGSTFDLNNPLNLQLCCRSLLLDLRLSTIRMAALTTNTEIATRVVTTRTTTEDPTTILTIELRSPKTSVKFGRCAEQ